MSKNDRTMDQITAEAVDWVQRLETTPGRDIEDRFAAWVDESPIHLDEFLRQRRIELGLRHIRAQRGTRRTEVVSVTAGEKLPE